VIDTIKTSVEASCNATISSADILSLATRDGIALVSYPFNLFFKTFYFYFFIN
jgi:peroxidase